MKSYGVTDELKEERLKITISKEVLNQFISQYKKYEEYFEVKSDTFFVKELLQTLTEDEQKIFINEKQDIMTILSYENIIKWFQEKEWNLLYVATKLIDNNLIETKDLGYFYYICLVTANELENPQEPLSYLPLIKEYYE